MVTVPPKHSAASIESRQVNPASPQHSPMCLCNQLLVAGLLVNYVPTSGFSGEDAVTLDELDHGGQHHILHFTLMVSPAAQTLPAKP